MELVGEAGGGGFSDQQGVWATEDEYRNWNAFPSSETPSDSTIHGGTRLFQNRSKATGKMFFKTKLCCKFRAGVCPYIPNCNFAHGLEELRKPPPNWQDILAEAPREQQHIPTVSTPDSRAEPQRSYKGRHCKKFYTEEGCPYGDNCTFIHEEQSRSRESVAISVTPTVGAGYGNIVNGANQKPSYWKTRICNKWETTGYCPFGSNCHFAHGVAELHNYGGGLVESEGKDSAAAPPETKPGGVPMKVTDVAVPSTLSAPHTDVYHMGLGVPVQRSSGIVQRPGQRSLQKWKGPDKISKIYGDWIDDIE